MWADVPGMVKGPQALRLFMLPEEILSVVPVLYQLVIKQ